MMHDLLSRLHEIPIYAYVIMIVIALVLWTTLAFLFQKRPLWKRVNTVLLALSIILIVSITFVLRQASIQSYSIIPFSSFELAKLFPDVYQEMILNVILYMPVGMTMPFVLSGRVRHPAAVTVVFALLLSIATEILQFLFMRGYTEVDDVMFNTIGAVLGAISFMITDPAIRKRNEDVTRI